MSEEENVIGEIRVKITDKTVTWDYGEDFTFQDAHFWLSVTLQMMMNKFLTKQ